MTYAKNLQVQHHQQDTGYYCGAAGAQMVLETIGSGLMDQAGLYNDNHSHGLLDPTTPWATPPDGLEWTLDHRAPATFQMRFVTYAATSEDSISRKIAWTIEHYDVAPVALVFGWAHWIVVRGMVVSQAPSSIADTGYTFTNFRVNDPWPPVPSSTYWPNPAAPPPPAHTATDGCGTGGNRGVADQIISYTQWQNTYMTGVPGGYWQGKYLAVCDPEPAPNVPGRMVRPRRKVSVDRLVTKARATTQARRSIEGLGIEDDEVWRLALTQTEPGTPVLVQRLDRNDDYYYIVPFARRGRVSAAAVLDARYGEFQQAAALPETEEAFLVFPDHREIVRNLEGRDIELADFAGSVKLRPESLVVPEIWVWKPCLESLSPLWPFKLISVGGTTLYMRIDGQIFSALHDEPPGA